MKYHQSDSQPFDFPQNLTPFSRALQSFLNCQFEPVSSPIEYIEIIWGNSYLQSLRESFIYLLLIRITEFKQFLRI